jgi:FkbM family methyltransferase
MQSTRIGKNTVWYENSEEFNELKKELYTEHRYYLELDKEDPVILDMGAHIGLATLYFKQIYPEATITAFEPHPGNFAILQKNVLENQLNNVALVQAAVAPKDGQIVLYEAAGPGEWRSGVGIIPQGWRGVQRTQPITVQAVGVLSYLENPIDLLKMDIEGMEYEVIRTAGEKLRNVRQMIIEVHPREGHRLAEIEKTLLSTGFKLEKHEDTNRLGKGLVVVKAWRK